MVKNQGDFKVIMVKNQGDFRVIMVKNQGKKLFFNST